MYYAPHYLKFTESTECPSHRKQNV